MLTKDSPAREIAQAMITDFKDNGRAMHWFVDRHGRRCMSAAIVHAIKPKDTIEEGYLSYAQRAIVEVVAPKLGFEDIGAICRFNNAHTDEEVIARLEQVA